MDAIRVNIRSGGAVSSKAVFVALAILPDGTRDVLRLWFQANEGDKFWARMAEVPRELPHRPQIHRLRLALQPLDPHVFEKALAQRTHILIRYQNQPLSD